MARICILTPGALGSNPRVVKEAQTLQDSGHAVTVISTRTLDIVDQRDDDILGSATWRSIRIDLKNRNDWLRVRVLQLAYRKLFRLTGISRFADKAFSPFLMPLSRAVRKVTADLYIAHYPAALPVAAHAAKCHNAHYAFDAEDFHLGDEPGSSKHSMTYALIHAIEKRYLPGCHYVTAASPGIARAYAKTYGIASPTVLLNVFPRAEAPASATRTGSATPGPSIYWVSQTIGPDRGLECAIRAIGLARTQPHLYLRGSLAEGFEEAIKAIAANSGVAERCHILPPVLPSQVIQTAQAYDVGLASETDISQNRQIALANKPFIYFLAGIPSLMSDIPAHQEFAKEAPGAAFLFKSDSPTDLAARIDELLGDPEYLAAVRAAALQMALERFNWDIEEATLLRCVGNSLQAVKANIEQQC